MRSSPSMFKRMLQSRDRMGSLQRSCALQRWEVVAAKAAKAQRGIREIIWMIRKRRISGCAFIAGGEGISPRTAWACNAVILQRLPTLQLKHRLRLRQLSPLQSRTIGWRLALMLNPVIGSSTADARLTSPAIDPSSSPTTSILQIWRMWRDTMESHRWLQDVEVLGWFASCQMERRIQSYFKTCCICQGCSITSHSVRSWTRMSKSNLWITAVSTSAIAMASRLPQHLRSMGYLFWNELWNRPNTPTSTRAACWHLWQLGVHLGMMQRSGCYGTAPWHTSV